MGVANPYSPHPSISYATSGMRNIERQSGKTIDEWVKIINMSWMRPNCGGTW